MSLSLLEAARQAPQRPAVILHSRVIDYAGLAERMLVAVAWLRRQGAPFNGVSNGSAALVASADVDTLAMMHALTALGVPFIPLHPRLTPQERRDVIEQTAPAVVVDTRWSDAAHALAPADPDSVVDVPDDERPLAILHTSGTSGRPKGVVLPRRAFLAAARGSEENLGWRPDDRWLLCLPLAHVGGLSIVTRCLLGRRSLVMLPPDTRLDAGNLAEAVERDRVTLMSLVPTLLDRLLALEGWNLPRHVRAILLGGAAASPRLLERAAERGYPVLTTYGLTEACSQVSTQRVGTVNTGQLGAGPPVAGVEVRIVDGIVQVRGKNLFSGYHPPGDPPLDAEGWLPTGDAGFLDEAGNLHLLGRRADLIVTGGENVYPAEVEAALERCAGIAEACVFGVEDERWGQIVAAALVPASGVRVDVDALAAALRGVLAPFKRPRRVALVEALARSASGKLDRRATATAVQAQLVPLQASAEPSGDPG
jgi:O-succinylbenzoic acid--CoA ligase